VTVHRRTFESLMCTGKFQSCSACLA